MIFWKPFIYDDKNYPLDHLHPFEMEVIQKAKGAKPERKYLFKVIFTLHCFSRKIKDGERNTKLEYGDNRETRIFCFERYELSKHLPHIIREIGNRKCFHTGHGNFLTIEILTKEGERKNYEIYFTVSKHNKKCLNLYIQSAYIRDNSHKKRTKKKPIRFNIIAFNVQNKKPIKTPK